MSNENPYEQAFNNAKSRYRITGVGGVSLPGFSHSSAPDPPKQDPSKNVQFKNGVITIGGRNVKTKNQKDYSSIKVFDYGKPKEDKKN